MGYYIRVLSPSITPVSLATLESALSEHGQPITISGDIDDDDWKQLIITHVGGSDVCTIERVPTSTENGRSEIDEFLEEIDDGSPKSAAIWLTSYLSTVRTIYIFQILNGTYEADGWDIVDTVKNAVWATAGGIFQADLEGFSNEDGYHILWQFSDQVTGDWWMAVLRDGKWLKFCIDLSNPAHRAAFQNGEVPSGVQVVS